MAGITQKNYVALFPSWSLKNIIIIYKPSCHLEPKFVEIILQKKI